MIRLVKFNLYNYKLYKKMVVEWSRTKEFTFNEKKFLFAERAFDHDFIVDFFINQDKFKKENKVPSLTYFLFETTVNSFIGYINYRLVSVESESDLFFSILPSFCDKGYGNNIVKLFMEVANEKNIAIKHCLVNANNEKAIKIMVKNNFKFKRETNSDFLVFQF